MKSSWTACSATEALDISTDITVLENMMAREGLSDDPIHRTQASQMTAPRTTRASKLEL